MAWLLFIGSRCIYQQQHKGGAPLREGAAAYLDVTICSARPSRDAIAPHLTGVLRLEELHRLFPGDNETLIVRWHCALYYHGNGHAKPKMCGICYIESEHHKAMRCWRTKRGCPTNIGQPIGRRIGVEPASRELRGYGFTEPFGAPALPAVRRALQLQRDECVLHAVIQDSRFVLHVREPALFVDDEMGPDDPHVRLAVHALLAPHAVRLRDGRLGVGQQRNGRSNLVRNFAWLFSPSGLMPNTSCSAPG